MFHITMFAKACQTHSKLAEIIRLRTLTLSNLTHHHPLHTQYRCHRRHIRLVGADDQEHATPMPSLCHGIFTD